MTDEEEGKWLLLILDEDGVDIERYDSRAQAEEAMVSAVSTYGSDDVWYEIAHVVARKPVKG